MPRRKSFVFTSCMSSSKPASGKGVTDIVLPTCKLATIAGLLAIFERTVQFSSFFHLLVDSIQIQAEHELSLC